MWHLGIEETPRWRPVTEVSVDLHDAVTTTDGPYVVGADGLLLTRDEQWHPVFDDGPAAQNRTLTHAAATADDSRVWVAGAKGAFGFYDVENTEKHDYSKPNGHTGGVDALVVAGTAGDERILYATGTTVHAGYVDDQCPTWEDAVDLPGSNAVTAMAAAPDGTAYATTTGGDVFHTTTTDDWTQVGVPSTTSTLTTVHATADYVWTANTGGLVFRYDPEKDNWTTVDVGDTAVRGFAGTGKSLIAAADDGFVYARNGPANWKTHPTPVDASLRAAAVTDPAVAVGRKGTILERQPEE